MCLRVCICVFCVVVFGRFGVIQCLCSLVFARLRFCVCLCFCLCVCVCLCFCVFVMMWLCFCGGVVVFL